MGNVSTLLPTVPRNSGNVPPSFASLSTEEPVSTAAMNDGAGRGGGPTVFQIRRIDGSFESGGGYRCASGHKNAPREAFQ